MTDSADIAELDSSLGGGIRSISPKSTAPVDKGPVQDQNEQDLLLNHEYDGIREFDNPMPKWWKWIFWATFYFSIGYVVHYHVTENGKSLVASYEADVAEARELQAQQMVGDGGLSEEKLTALMADPALMADAQQLFVQRCSPCHGTQGEGKIGPNLTDEYWLHGNASLVSIHHSISEGFPAKGMPPWNRQLRPVELMKLSAFVGSIRNTNVPGPKGPEGTPIQEPGAAPAVSTQPQ